MRLIEDTTDHCYACGQPLQPSSNHCPSCGRWARVGQTAFLVGSIAAGAAAGVDAVGHGAGVVGFRSSALAVATCVVLFIRQISAHPAAMAPATSLEDALRDARLILIMMVGIGVPVHWRMEFTEPLALQLLIMFVLFPVGFALVFLLRGLFYVALPRLRHFSRDRPRCIACKAAISPRADFCQFCGSPQADSTAPGRRALPGGQAL